MKTLNNKLTWRQKQALNNLKKKVVKSDDHEYLSQIYTSPCEKWSIDRIKGYEAALELRKQMYGDKRMIEY